MNMNEVTKQDFENLTAAVVEGFAAIHQRFEEVDERFNKIDERFNKVETTLDQHGTMIDHIAGRVDDLWTEAGAQTVANRRFEARLDRLELQMGLGPISEDAIAA